MTDTLHQDMVAEINDRRDEINALTREIQPILDGLSADLHTLVGQNRSFSSRDSMMWLYGATSLAAAICAGGLCIQLVAALIDATADTTNVVIAGCVFSFAFLHSCLTEVFDAIYVHVLQQLPDCTGKRWVKEHVKLRLIAFIGLVSLLAQPSGCASRFVVSIISGELLCRATFGKSLSSNLFYWNKS